MSGINVAVSGITGFIGSHITADLLKKGYTVHGTLRRNTPEKIAHLPTDTPGTLKVFEADLLVPDSFDEPTKGCKYAMHVASPYILKVKDPQKELVDPAVKGTLSFLESCRKNGVEKIVVTSSFAAITDTGILGKVFDEGDWNDHSSLNFLPYYYSKTQAERAAWELAEEHKMNIVVINPVGVFGPSLTKSINESPSVLIQIANGEFPGILDLSLPCVDVRDVSEAHIRAMESATSEGRYLCCSDEPMFHIRDFTRLLVEAGFKLPTRDLTGSFFTKIFRFLGPVFPGGTPGQVISVQLGTPPVPTNAKITKDLGMSFIPAEQSVSDTLQDLLKWGHLKKKPESS